MLPPFIVPGSPGGSLAKHGYSLERCQHHLDGSRVPAFVLSKFLAPFHPAVTFSLSLWLLYFLIPQLWVDPPTSVCILGVLFCPAALL